MPSTLAPSLTQHSPRPPRQLPRRVFGGLGWAGLADSGFFFFPTFCFSNFGDLVDDTIFPQQPAVQTYQILTLKNRGMDKILPFGRGETGTQSHDSK